MDDLEEVLSERLQEMPPPLAQSSGSVHRTQSDELQMFGADDAGLHRVSAPNNAVRV